MLLHRPNINNLLLSLFLGISYALVITPKALSQDVTSPQAVEQQAPTVLSAQSSAAAATDNDQADKPVDVSAVKAQAGVAQEQTAVPSQTKPQLTSLPTGNSTDKTEPPPQTPTTQAAPAAAPVPALVAPAAPDNGAVSTSLSAPLNAESARKFSGQGDSASAVDLHPPGHFSTAEPLNPSAENLLRPDPVAPPPVPLAPAAPFTLLNVTLAPGTASRMAWSPEDSFSGIATPTPVLVVHGAKPGPKLCLTAAVHGDEVNGIEVVRHILYDLDPHQLAGTVIGVPIVNMQGFRRGSRYLADRRDLNRFFPGHSQGSAASRIAASLFNEVITSCQYLIDIHTGSMSRTNLPQLRADLTRAKVVELANQLGDIAVLQNKGAKGSLRRAAMDHGIAAVVIEAGEPYTFQESAIDKSLQAIKTLLSQLKMYSYAPSSTTTATPQYYTSQWLRAKAGGMLFSRVSLGQAVKSGDLLGVITDPITNQSNLIYSPKDAVVLGMALNQVLHPGFAVYHLGIAASLPQVQQSDSGPEDFGSDSTQRDNQDIH